MMMKRMCVCYEDRQLCGDKGDQLDVTFERIVRIACLQM